MGADEVTTDMPEYSDLSVYWNERARGLGGTVKRPVSMAAEENALCYADDSYRREDIVLHEFAHGFHTLGVDPALKHFNTRLNHLYLKAKRKGLWKNTYALSSVHEYFVSFQLLFSME